MKRGIWLLLGALAGLLAGVILDRVIPAPAVYLRWVQLGFVLMGAGVAAFIHSGARAVTKEGREPAESTDRQRPAKPRAAP